MSYLHPIRLHFAGRFRADVATVNNRPAHFNNDAFTPALQLPLSGAADRTNWQPAGTAAWRLLDCRVTRACRADGSFAATLAEDGTVGLSVRDAGDRVSAKIVDLDPQQQGVSMIFGLIVRLVDAQGQTILQGEFEPNAFFGLQTARVPPGQGFPGSAYFQSVLRNVEWGALAATPCLQQMKQASAAGMLSIKFITDSYRTGGLLQGYGRIVGTIGPHIAGEPRTFVMGRHLAPTDPENQPFAHVMCRVDTERRKVLVDVGNALPMKTAEGDFEDRGDIALAVNTPGGASAIGSLPYREADSYANTAGIYELPAGRTLTDAELAALAQNPLQLTAQPAGATAAPVANESADGVYVRPEHFVFRLDPGATETTDLIVTKFGTPFAGATVQTGAQPFSLPAQSPLPELSTSGAADANGRIRLTIKAVGPPNPRGFIDGQVYRIFFAVQGAATQPFDFDEDNFISLLAFNPTPMPAFPTWEDVHPILEQYSNLYPRPHGPDPYAPFAGRPASHPVVDLNDYDSVAGFARHIRRALELPVDHPNHMPVTRDLSEAKRMMLLKWLREPGADGKPRRDGVPAMPTAAVAAAAARAVAPVARFAETAFTPPQDRVRRKSAPDA
jgi:hypothetical protein